MDALAGARSPFAHGAEGDGRRHVNFAGVQRSDQPLPYPFRRQHGRGLGDDEGLALEVGPAGSGVDHGRDGVDAVGRATADVGGADEVVQKGWREGRGVLEDRCRSEGPGVRRGADGLSRWRRNHGVRVVARGWHGNRNERGHGQNECYDDEPLHDLFPPRKNTGYGFRAARLFFSPYMWAVVYVPPYTKPFLIICQGGHLFKKFWSNHH